MTISTGHQIAGRYSVSGQLGRGGMGVVYLAQDLAQGKKEVAVKAVLGEFLGDRMRRERFLEEARVWIRLGEHPNVVRAHAVLYAGMGEVYVVADRIRGGDGRQDPSLKALLTGQPLPLRLALTIGIDVVRGMAHAARQVKGLVHRDLKPANVLVSADGRALVTDFGLATVASDQDVWGTAQYMAPEQWGRGATLDPRADIYALGCILYEMLTGRLPVNGARETCRAMHEAGEAEKLAAKLAPGLREVVQGCVARERNKRFENWEAVQAALERMYAQAVGTVRETGASGSLPGDERLAEAMALNDLALGHMDIGMFEAARSCLKKAMRIAQEENAWPLGCILLKTLGDVELKAGDARKAVVFFEGSLEAARKIGFREMERGIWSGLGAAALRLGMLDQAVQFDLKHLDVSRETGNASGEALALRNLGVVYTKRRDVRRALSYYEDALVVARRIGDLHMESVLLGDLGLAYRDAGDLQRAVEFARRRRERARELADPSGEVVALETLGAACFDAGEWAEGRRLLDEALAIARRTGNRLWEGNIVGRLGLAHARAGDNVHAGELFLEQLRIATASGDRPAELVALNNLGSVHAASGDVVGAIKFYEELRSVARMVGDSDAEGKATSNLRALYLSTGGGAPTDAVVPEK